MAGSEGSGQTDLLSGWSCVVHRPSEDPEPSELPSTVDMAAFSSGLSVEPTQNTNNEDSCDSESDSDSDSNNSGSDVSGSCSQSDSSDSESSSSSQGSSSRSSSPEFSVTSSQTNGLRLKIATVRKSCTSPIEKPSKPYSDVKFCDKNTQNSSAKGCTNLSSSSESPCSRSSSESSSDSDAPSTTKSDNSEGKTIEKNASCKKPVAKVRLKQVEKKTERRTTRSVAACSPKPVPKTKTRPRRTRKMASLPLSRGSTGSSSDSEDGSESDRTMLASCSLQEIRQEDLAAILPDQQECDAFGGFDCRPDKSSPHTGDGSGSDMELPQQAVNALIQRTTESSSESESRLPLNPNTLYANSLLQQFVAQTQMLNAPSSAQPHTTDSSLPAPVQTATENTNAPTEVESTKRKRGRPRKTTSHKVQADPKPDKTEPAKSILNLEYGANPNVSPDSGIQNSSDHVSSPEPSPTPNPKPKFNQEVETKKNTSTDTKHSNKNNGESKTNTNQKSASSKLNSTNKVKEQPKLPITSNSFDRVLYGNADRVLYPPRRKVGRPPITRKGPGRPPKHKPGNTATTTTQEVKPPDKPSKVVEPEPKANSSPSKASTKQPEKVDLKLSKHKKNLKSTCDTPSTTTTNSIPTPNVIKKDTKELKPKDVQKKSKAALLREICEKVSKRLDVTNKCTQKCENKQEANGKNPKNHKGVKSFKKGIANRVVLGSKNKLDPLRAKYTTLKNSKVMHSKHKDKKHKKCKFKILKPITATLHDPKLNSEIDKLIADFVKLCSISSTKPSKENVPEMLKVLKKASKKRKTSDYSERKKKKQSVSSSFNKEANSNEQRLPLKKRHYHLTNNDSGTVTSQTDTETESKPKLPSSTKDTKTVSTVNNKVVVDKHKSVIASSSTSTIKVGVANTPEQDTVDVKPNNNASPKANLNNNDYTAKLPKSQTVGTHIDEAIEACITRYSSPVPETAKMVKPDSSKSIKLESCSPNKEDKINNTSSTSITTTTPKKRHRLEAKNCHVTVVTTVNEVVAQIQPVKDEKPEDNSKLPKNKTVILENVVSELKAKKTLPPKPADNNQKKPAEKKSETVAQIITRKKNRLEDLTLTLAHKVNSTSIIDTPDNQKRKKDTVKPEEAVVDHNQKRKKDTVKPEEVVVDHNQKRKKDTVKPEETIVDHNQKRKKDTLKPEETVVDHNQKRKKDTVKPEETVVDHNQKRKKEIPKVEEIPVVETVLKRKKETAKLEEEVVENQKRKKDVKTEETTVDNQKRKKETVKVEETISDNNQKRKKDTIKLEEPVVDNQKRKKEIPKVDETISDNQKRKKESIKVEEPTTDNNQKRKKENIKSEEVASRASVIKSPVSKKAKPTENEKLDCITADKPTGIFMPTVDIELHIPASKIHTSRASDKLTLELREKISKDEQPVVYIENLQIKETPKVVEESKPNKTAESDSSSRKKIRKRRAINRTGFPTVKKKKKRSFMSESMILAEVVIPAIQQKLESVEERNVCDRVPQEGEKYSAFLQRTEKLNVSNAILEKLQKSVVSPSNHNEQHIPKYESEEESMHELGVVRNGRPLSRLSIKQSRSKDVSPSVSVDTSVSDKNSKNKDSQGDLDELSLEARLELLKTSLTNKTIAKSDIKWRTRRGRSLGKSDKSILYKRRLRDISPASSIEPLNEKKLREEIAGSGDEAKRTKKAPRWRKRYLVAGLFSDYYKEDDEVARMKRTEAATKSRIVYNPEEHPYGLLPPPYHCGKYLRCRKIPFQLPYDLWWQHTNSQLPGRDIVPSWNYRKIRTNVYNVRTTAGACEPQACNCSPIAGCGDDCINRLVLAECPATHKCLNQRIQKHEWAPGLEKFMTADKGWGVRTKLPIKNGEFILEYVGEVVSDHEFKERMASRYAHDTHHYCLHLDGGLVIDGHRMGGDGRFVNHSCEPNCEMQKWSVNGQFRMALFALRDICACEELTYDYNFSLFNPAEGQECKCGSVNCRGVIGGKSQRVRQSTSSSNSGNSGGQVGRVGRPRKNQAKRTTSGPKELPLTPAPPPVAPTPLIKPMSNSQRSYVRDHHCFLLRNFNKAKQNRERSVCSVSVTRMNASTPTDHSATTFMNHLNALRQPRNMKTRRLAQAEDNPELKKTAQLASILRDLLNVVTTAKDEKNELLCTTFLNLPSKRKVPEYYQRITEPIDLTTIEQNITTGVYRTVESFDGDVNRIFLNAVRFFGRTSEPGIAATRLKKIYCESKQQSLSKLEEVIGEKLPPNFVSSKRKGEEEDVIRCICGMYRDEGLMIQCERCLVWQHCECVRADAAAASYHCERCVPRLVDFEIALDEYTEHGHRYYMTLLRGDLQLGQGDTVYVLRDIPITGTDRKHTYETIEEIKYTDLDIFRIERLWKDCKSGQRFAYGHHYLRPHETFHEPTRKFFPNEVMRVPLYEAVPVELVISHCWVMDINTYCKGRPIGAPEEHIYICEYRVDKSARLFSKISKAKYPICTKSYAFERFDVRLKISRTYTPHDLDPAFVKPRGRKPHETDDVRELPQLPVHVPVVRTRSEKKTRLNKILLALLNKLPTKQALDVSYLLEGGRRRKKQVEK